LAAQGASALHAASRHSAELELPILNYELLFVAQWCVAHAVLLEMESDAGYRMLHALDYKHDAQKEVQ
jgi:hypothetical protein